MEYLTGLFTPAPERSTTYIVGASVLTTFAILTVSRLAFQGTQKQRQKIIRSPRGTLLATLSEAEVKALDYPPDVLPGGRDVESPYGTIRVYEWGPEEGRKVLLVHGISTPCIALGAVGHGLVEKGCRVMLLDLWGRGYSDSCVDLPHDDRLYATQILLAITSSPLSWTGSGASNAKNAHPGFSLVGYSLGGGIAASFAAYFPQMVHSLVLLAPAGLIRPEHLSTRSRILYSIGVVPEGLLQWLVKRRLAAGPMYKDENKTTAVGAVSAEVGLEDNKTASTIPHPPLSHSYPNLAIDTAVSFQISHHHGFIHSFMSSIRFAPITSQHTLYRRLGNRPNTDTNTSPTPSKPSPVLFLVGRTDPIIIPAELKADAEELLGAEAMVWREVDAAHDFPVTKPGWVVREICAAWGL